MKKLLLSLGAVAAVVAPVATVVACGDTDDNSTNPGTTGGNTDGGHVDGHTVAVTVQSTKTATELGAVTVEDADTSKKLATKLGVAATSIANTGTVTYSYDATTYTLTTTSKIVGKTFVGTLILTPKAAPAVKPLTDAEKALTSEKTFAQLHPDLTDAHDFNHAMKLADVITLVQTELGITLPSDLATRLGVTGDKEATATYIAGTANTPGTLQLGVTGLATAVNVEFAITPKQ